MQHSANLEGLGIAAWPFSVVPDDSEPLIWADRAALLRQIERLVRRLNNYQASTLHLLWADFGAGKTHTLLYLRQLARADRSGDIFPAYAALPKESRSFVDIYRVIIQSIGFESLLSTFETARRATRQNAPVRSLFAEAPPGLMTAFEGLRIGSDAIRGTAKRWLLADVALTNRELYEASLPGKIRTAEQALAVLGTVTKLILTQRSRILLMIDEFQRAGMLRQSYRDEMNAGLHTYFNNCPRGLSLFLSFSFGSAKDMRYYLNEELRSRADPYIFTIPELDVLEACQFLADLVTACKAGDGEVNVSIDVLEAIANYVNEQGSITPRKLMQAAAAVFSEASLDLEDGVITALEAEYARDVLNDIQPSTVTEEQ